MDAHRRYFSKPTSKCPTWSGTSELRLDHQGGGPLLASLDKDRQREIDQMWNHPAPYLCIKGQYSGVAMSALTFDGAHAVPH